MSPLPTPGSASADMSDDKGPNYFWDTCVFKPPEVMDDPYYTNPRCECGGGRFLGHFHTTRMYDNHQSIECIIDPKKFCLPYLTPAYFNALQMLESITTEISIGISTFKTAVINLIKTWSHCRTILSNVPWTGTHVFMHYAVGESAILILDPKWENISKKYKYDLSTILGQILCNFHLTRNHVEAIRACHFLLSVLKSPWDHHYLSKLLFGDPSQEEVADFIQFEKCHVFALRLKILCKGNCEAEAFKLSSLAMSLHNYEVTIKHQYDQTDFEYIRDIYFACLEWTDNRTELVKHLQKLSSENDCRILLDKYSNKIEKLLIVKKENRPRIFKSVVSVIEIAAYVIVIVALKKANLHEQFSEVMNKWSTLMIMLMESDLDTNISICRLKDIILKFVDVAPTANHLYIICGVCFEDFGSTFPRTLFIELYIKALATNINEKEKHNYLCDADQSFDSLKLLVQGYLKLANVLEDILSVYRECVLSAYSLMPSSDLMARVEYLAIKSGKLLPKNNSNEPKTVCNTKIMDEYLYQPSCSKQPDPKPQLRGCDSGLGTKLLNDDPDDSYNKIHQDLNNLPNPLSTAKQDDLIAILKYPRFGKFNWDVEWPKMKMMCQQYLDNLDIVIKRNCRFACDFKYVNMNIDKYNKCREKKLKLLTNDKGYFTSDAEDTESDEEVSTSSSEEFQSFSGKQSRINKRKLTVARKRKVNVRKQKASSKRRSKCGGDLLKKSKVVSKKEFDIKSTGELPKRNLRSKKNVGETDSSINSSMIKNKIKMKVKNTVTKIASCTATASVTNIDINIQDDEEKEKRKEKLQPLPREREKRIVNKNQHKDFDYSWKRKRNDSKTNNVLPNKAFKCDSSPTKTPSNDKQTHITSKNLHLMGNTKFDLPHPSNQHLDMLSKRIPQLSSLDFMVPANTDHIVNVVQIQVTSNTLTNVSQTQTEHVSNRHSNNEVEKNTNDSQTDTHSLDNFVSVYQSNSLNNSTNSIQNSGVHQGECSFTGSVSVSNQRIATDSTTNVHNISQQEINKPASVTHDVQIDLEHQQWNDIQLQNAGERLQSTIENTVHLSSNVIVRTSEITSPSHVTLTTGQIANTVKKPTYCVKTQDRFIDLSLPTSISSISTNSNRSINMPVTNKSNFEQKVQQNFPVQTSVGLQVNFNNQQSEGIQNPTTLSSQTSQIRTSIAETSTNTLNDQIINTMNSRISTSISNTSFDQLKSNMSIVNPVSSIQTQTCIGLQPINEVSNPNASVISLMIVSTQNQVIKSNVHNSLYTSPQSQKVQLTDASQISQTNRSEEQKRIDNLKLISQTFTATSEAIKFVTSSTESQRLIQSTDKNNTANLSIFQNDTEGVSNVSQESDSNSKLLNRGRGSMRTYESKTRALKQANMSDMFVFEKGTLYAVQDDVVNQIEPTKSITSSRNNITTNVRVQNRQSKELLEKPKPSPNASPNITITGSMLPRFQQVFGKTKFPSSTVINDTSSLCSTSVSSNPSSPGLVVNRPNMSTSRVYSSSKGVQTNHDVDSIGSNTMNCSSPKILQNKLQHNNTSISKANNIITIGNNKNVIMTCKPVSTVKNIPQVSATSSNHQLLASNIDTNNIVKKEITGGISKVSAVFTTTSCNNSSIASSSSNVIYSIPIQSDSKVNNNLEKHLQGVAQIQRQLKVSPSIIQSVLRKHPTWQQNCFRQGKQSTEVQTSSTLERLIPANISNIVKTTNESTNNKVSVNTSKPNTAEPNVSSSMMEQVREFESVLEEVRKTSLMNEMSTANMLPQINHEIIQIHSPTENVDLLNTDSNQTLFSLNKKSSINNEEDRCSFSFLNQTLSNDLSSEEKEPVTASPTIISVRSVTPTPPVTSATNNSNVSINPVDGSTQCSKQIANKTKPVIKTPASSPSTSAVKVPVLQKPLPKLQEDEQTTQRIYAILDKYAEQLRNSPELKNKPAPRRRTNPPTNPSLNTKRKKSTQLNLKTCSQQTSCSSSGMEMSPTSDVQAIDSEDSSNAVSHYSHIIDSPSRNSDEQTTTTVISESPLIENALINVNDVIKKINIDAEIKSKVSQSTQIVVSGTSGSFLSLPEGTTGNVRLLVASGKNQKMYRLHCPVTGPGPVLFHQIATKDSCSNDVKMSSIQNINESTILSALTSDDLQVSNTGLGNDILLTNTSQNSTVFEHKINKSDIILESMEKAKVLENNEKRLSFPVMKKSQASQSTFSVIHTLPNKPKSESVDNIELLSESPNNTLENVQKNYCDNEQTNLSVQREPINSNINQNVNQQEKLSEALQEERSFVITGSSESGAFEDIKFPSFHSREKVKHKNNENTSSVCEKNSEENITSSNENKFVNTNTNQISVGCMNDNQISNDSNNLREMEDHDKKEELSNVRTDVTSNTLDFSNSNDEEEDKKESNMVLNNIAAASAAEIISTVNQSSTTYKQKDELSLKNVKADCESENENENTLSNTVYNMLDDQSAAIMNTKIGSLVVRLKNNRSAKNWNSCLSKIMTPGTFEKLMEGENLKQLQESFLHAKINTFKDLKIFVYEQCKKFDNNVETPKEYDLYDDIDGLGVDKPSTNELFPEVAILNDLDKSVSPTRGLLQASTSKSNDAIILQPKRKSVLSHTTASTVLSAGMEQTSSVVCKKGKAKVSFLKQALYNEMNQDSNDCESKLFLNGNTKTILDAIEQIASSPESPSNTTAVDSETCMSEDSTSTISSGTPHYNFRKKNKRKNVEEDGFIESQVIKRMYRGRTSEDSEEKSEHPKISNTKIQTTEQKPTVEKKESNRRISSRLKNNVKNNQHSSNKSPQTDNPPYKGTTTRTSLRRVSRKST